MLNTFPIFFQSQVIEICRKNDEKEGFLGSFSLNLLYRWENFRRLVLSYLSIY